MSVCVEEASQVFRSLTVQMRMLSTLTRRVSSRMHQRAHSS